MKKGGGASNGGVVASNGASGHQPPQQHPRMACSPIYNLLKYKSLSLSMHSLSQPSPLVPAFTKCQEFVYSSGGSHSLFFNGADG
jgi:hypothetical protein